MTTAIQSALTIAVEQIKPRVAAELGAMKQAARAKAIRKMCRDAEKAAEIVRAKLRQSGEKDEAVWQREMAIVDAPYFAALELFSDDCPRGERDDY